MQSQNLSSAFTAFITGLPREHKEIVLRELARECGYVFVLESNLVAKYHEVEQLSLEFEADA
jgi:hypothetical protein